MENINENIDISKSELKKLIRNIFDEEFKKENDKKKNLTKEEVKDIVRKMMENQYKFFWDKRSFWTKNI